MTPSHWSILLHNSFTSTESPYAHSLSWYGIWRKSPFQVHPCVLRGHCTAMSGLQSPLHLRADSAMIDECYYLWWLNLLRDIIWGRAPRNLRKCCQNHEIQFFKTYSKKHLHPLLRKKSSWILTRPLGIVVMRSTLSSLIFQFISALSLLEDPKFPLILFNSC